MVDGERSEHVTVRLSNYVCKEMDELVQYYREQTPGTVTRRTVIEEAIRHLYHDVNVKQGRVAAAGQLTIFGNIEPVYEQRSAVGRKVKTK